MKPLLIFTILILPVSLTAQVPAISPTTPVVQQRATQIFTCTLNCGTGGTWSCSGCAGSINSSTGVYTAPASVTNQQSCGGTQCLPNNHIINENISALSVNSNSSTWIAQAGTNPFHYLPSFPVNYCNGSTPTKSMVFYYSPLNNGTFEIPAYPFARIETGWASAYGTPNANSGAPYNPFNQDHHFICEDTTTGTIEEMYQYYPAGTATSVESCPTCTSQSGQKYLASTYLLPVNSGGTDAAGLDLWPLSLRLQELEQAVATSGTINHALRFTLSVGYIANSYIWPATQNASGGGLIPYGARARLKSSYNVAGFTYSGCTGTCLAAAKILLTQLQQYGIILADIGSSWETDIEYTAWPKTYANALNAISNTAITPSNFEFVDESGLEITSTSGEANTGRETVTFTRTSDSATASVDVVVQGIAVTLPQDTIYIAAGSPNQTFTAFTNDPSGVTWSASSGTIDSTTGVYTVPSSESSIATVTITATSVTNSAVAASMTVEILPNPSNVIRLVPGQTSNYTDSASHTWYAGPLGNCDAASSSSGAAFGYSNGGSWSGTDITLYEVPIYAANDLRCDFVVPNGVYSIDAKIANNSTSDQGNFLIETQGSSLASPTDVYGSVRSNQPYDYTTSVTVSTGMLSFVLRAVNTVGNNVAPFLSALSISQTSGGSGGSGPPAPPTNLRITTTQ